MLYLNTYGAEDFQLTSAKLVEKNQPREKFANEPVTNFTQQRKIIVDTELLESIPIRKIVTSDTAIHAGVECERRTIIKHEQAYSTDRSAVSSTTSVTIKTEATIPTPELQCSFPFDIDTRFGNRTGLCVALTKAGKRCSRPVGKSDLVRCSLRTLATHYSSQDYEAFSAELNAFINVAFCGRSHRRLAIEILESSNKERCRKFLVDLFGIDDADAFSLWASATSEPQNPETQQVVIDKSKTSVGTPSIPSTVTTNIESHTALSIGPTSTSVSSTMKMSVAKTTTVFSTFQRCQPQWTKGLSPDVALQKVIAQKLTPTDLKSGFIYIFWVEGMSWGHLKIGRSVDPRERLRQWNKKCKHTHVYVEDIVKVPHVSRVERLMHIELKDVRKSFKCAGCQTVHWEWFEVSQSHAKKVFEKWKNWINQHPYGKDHTGNWMLKPDSSTTIADVCKPVPLEKKSHKPIGPKKHSSPPRRKVSNAHSLANRGRMTNDVKGSLSELKVLGDGSVDQKLPDEIVHLTKSTNLLNSTEPPKSEILGSTVVKASSSPSKEGRDTAQGTLTATASKNLESKRKSLWSIVQNLS